MRELAPAARALPRRATVSEGALRAADESGPVTGGRLDERSAPGPSERSGLVPAELLDEPFAALDDEPGDPGPLRPAALLGGTRLRVVRPLGQGGMGEVYEVEHRTLGRRFALKVLRRDQRRRADLARRLEDEARALARLCHPRLVQVMDLGELDDGRPYFLMELLAGRDLRSELARVGVLAVPVAVEVIAQALDGLAAAHAAGLVHCDVKLENLFFCEDGSVKVLDFGVARPAHGEDGAEGAVVGTPRTMAPEQGRAGAVDGRSDLYAAGLALYELVAGRGPFDELRGNDVALRYAHAHKAPPPPSALAPQPVPPELDAVVARALAKEPEGRFQSAAEMAEALRELLGERRRRRGFRPLRTPSSPVAGEARWPGDPGEVTGSRAPTRVAGRQP